jgi:putative membrane protein
MTSDSVERRLHPAGAAIIAIRGASSAWFVAVAIIAGAGVPVGVLIVLGLLVLVGGAAYVEWRVTRYAVVDGGLRYRRGLISRTEIDVPASRISALDTSRGILQRIFGVVALEVQTAGGGGKPEVVLHAVSAAEAERLRHALGHRGADRADPAAAPNDAAAATGAGDAPAATDPASALPTTDQGAPARPMFRLPDALPVEDSQVVFRITPRDLLLAGITSPSGAVIGAVMAALYGPLQDVLGDSTRDSLESGAEQVVQAAPLLVAGFAIVVILILSVLSTVLAFHGFEVTRDAKRLRVRRGLLTERTGTLPLDRVHALRIVESPLRQAFGFVAIEAEVAGWALQDDAVKTIIPFLRRSDLPVLLPQLIPGYVWPQQPLATPPERATRRYVVRAAWLPGLIAIGLVAAVPLGWARVPAAVLVLGLGVALGLAQARAAGWLVDDRLLVLRSRTVARRTFVVLIDRMQFRASASTPFTRRARLATLRVRLSSRRTAQIAYLEAHDVGALLARLRPRTAAAPLATPLAASERVEPPA